MSAEVSFTKRAAAELSRCFNGLSVVRTNSTKKSSSSSSSSSANGSPASCPTSSSDHEKLLKCDDKEKDSKKEKESIKLLHESGTQKMMIISKNESGKRRNSSSASLIAPKAGNQVSSSPFHHRKASLCINNTSTSSSSSSSNGFENSLKIFQKCEIKSKSNNVTNNGLTNNIVTPSPSRKFPPPPLPARKTSLARCKNFLLGLDKPSNKSELISNSDFLNFFFQLFQPKEKTVLAQVCTFWRDVLYNDIETWKHLIFVINCNELRKANMVTGRGIELLPESELEDQKIKAANALEEVKNNLYLSIELRKMDSIAIVGAKDEDVLDFTSKMSTNVLNQIKFASVRSSSVSDKGLEAFLVSINKSLTSLELTGCNEVTDAARWTAAVPGLEKLVIMDCINVADETVAAITRYQTKMKELHLQAYHVTDVCMSFFGSLRPNLTTIYLEHSWELGSNGIMELSHSLPNLEILSLAGCSKVTDDAVEVVAESMKRLKYLNLSWCSRISDASLEFIACDLAETIEELILDRCIHITDIGLGFISTIPRLRSLSIRWCPQVRDFGLQTICSMKSLKSLSLAGCPNLSVNGLSCLVQAQHLEEIELTNCPGATPELLHYLSEHLSPTTTVIV